MQKNLSLILALVFVITWTVADKGGAQVLESTELKEVLAESEVLPTEFREVKATERGIRAVYEVDGMAVILETRRGPRRPVDMMKIFPELPEVEMDTRFLNQDGEMFFARYGGHGPSDPAWEVPVANTSDLQELENEDEKAARQFAMAADALAALRDVRFASEFQRDYDELVGLHDYMQSLQQEDKEETGALEIPDAVTACNYRHEIAIHDQPCQLCPGIGRHSATIFKNISSSGQTVVTVTTANHGAYADTMPRKCRWRSPSANRCRTTAMYKCKTPYLVLSTLGRHNCNDDTETQVKAVFESSCPTGLSGVCRDSAVNLSPNDCPNNN